MNRPRERAHLHGRGKDRNAARPLTAREVAEFRRCHVSHPGDRRRLAGIEEFRRVLNQGCAAKEVHHE